MWRRPRFVRLSDSADWAASSHVARRVSRQQDRRPGQQQHLMPSSHLAPPPPPTYLPSLLPHLQPHPLPLTVQDSNPQKRAQDERWWTGPSLVWTLSSLWSTSRTDSCGMEQQERGHGLSGCPQNARVLRWLLSRHVAVMSLPGGFMCQSNTARGVFYLCVPFKEL